MSIDASSGMVKLLNKAIATADAARKALAVLRDVEWDGHKTCVDCREWQPMGHANGCALAEAIRDLEAAL